MGPAVGGRQRLDAILCRWRSRRNLNHTGQNWHKICATGKFFVLSQKFSFGLEVLENSRCGGGLEAPTVLGLMTFNSLSLLFLVVSITDRCHHFSALSTLQFIINSTHHCQNYNIAILINDSAMLRCLGDARVGICLLTSNFVVLGIQNCLCQPELVYKCENKHRSTK